MDGHDIYTTTASPLPSILNFRDVARTINSLNNDLPLLCENRIFRSAQLDDASSDDRSTLTLSYHIKTIIDLRSTTEHIEQAKKREATTDALALAATSSEQAADVFRIGGVKYHSINLNGGAFGRALLWKLSGPKLAKFTSLMALGYRNKAVSILGKEVMAPRGLIGLGQDTLDHSTKELYRVFSVLADRESYPLLIHCTQGKDRTGLVVILLLLFLEVPIASINLDYLVSEKHLESEKASRLVETRQRGLGDDFVECPTDFVDQISQHIDSVYGGPEKYLERLGVDGGMRRRIQDNFREGIASAMNGN